MVNLNKFSFSLVWAISLLLVVSAHAHATETGAEFIAQSISADACDDRMADDGEHTAENRAVDKAGLAAVKLSGIIQRGHSDLSANAIDTIAYRIIDEYMVNTAHAIKFSDNSRVCVKLMADIEMTSADLDNLIQEYKDSEAPAEQIAEVVKKVEATTSFKPKNLSEKKLIFIKNMIFWNGNDTNHYSEYLTGLLSDSEYFYITANENLADFVIIPQLLKSEVDEIDSKNHKMQMSVELKLSSPADKDFAMREQQSHFILFASDKDEQEIADDLLRKLLMKSAKELSRKINKYSATHLENSQISPN